MNQPGIEFSINRICASRMPLREFAAMAQRLGLRTVELRNDLQGVELLDGADPMQVGAVMRDHGLAIRSINALQRFEQFDPTREQEALALARYAKACGAQSLVLCPTNSRQDARSADQRHEDLVHALRRLGPLLGEHGLTGLVEPLGFEECALRRKSQAVRAIRECAISGVFSLVHDTFHHHLALEAQWFPELTGLVHVSGVEDPGLGVDQMRDGHRVLVGPSDRLGNVAQLRALRQAGYRGVASFEPFSSAITQAADIEARLRASIDYLSAALAE